jgi:hypothetical protein
MRYSLAGCVLFRSDIFLRFEKNFQRHINSLDFLMSENLATRAKKKSILTYSVLAALFVVIFGGITLIAFFVSKLNF